jgi:hypothetical protein
MRSKVFDLVWAPVLGATIWMAGLALATGVSFGHPANCSSWYPDSAEKGSYGPAPHFSLPIPASPIVGPAIAVLPLGDGVEPPSMPASNRAGARVNCPQATASSGLHIDPDRTWHFPSVTHSPFTFSRHIFHGSTLVRAPSPVTASRGEVNYGDPTAPTSPRVSMLLLGAGLVGLGFLRRKKFRAA